VPDYQTLEHVGSIVYVSYIMWPCPSVWMLRPIDGFKLRLGVQIVGTQAIW